MTVDRTDEQTIRAAIENAYPSSSTYGHRQHSLAALSRLVGDRGRLQGVATAAREFVATTSVLRQSRACRPAFEALAVALIALDRETDKA